MPSRTCRGRKDRRFLSAWWIGLESEDARDRGGGGTFGEDRRCCRDPSRADWLQLLRYHSSTVAEAGINITSATDPDFPARGRRQSRRVRGERACWSVRK